jgi:hypothetical protein
LLLLWGVGAGRVVAAKIVHIVAGNIVSAHCIVVGKFVVDVQHIAAVIVVVSGTGVHCTVIPRGKEGDGLWPVGCLRRKKSS